MIYQDYANLILDEHEINTRRKILTALEQSKGLIFRNTVQNLVWIQYLAGKDFRMTGWRNQHIQDIKKGLLCQKTFKKLLMNPLTLA